MKNNPPDWIVIDGSDVLQQICEMTMRYRNNLMPYQGISNRNLWKERKTNIRQIHESAIGTAKKGVIYTAYTKEKEIVVEGETISRIDIPQWIEAIMLETDTVIKVTSEQDKIGRKFIATVESSKTGLQTGKQLDITDKGIKELVKK